MTMETYGEDHPDHAEPDVADELEPVTNAMVRPLTVSDPDQLNSILGGVAIRLGNDDGETTPTYWLHWGAALELAEGIVGSARLSGMVEGGHVEAPSEESPT